MNEETKLLDLEVRKALAKIQNNIDELNKQKELIKNIDFSKPINEEEWHEICKTPLRSSDILCVIIRNIFPQAKNIKRYSNCVVFDLLDFSISIPTTNCRGISISTKWYIPDKDIPKLALENYDNILRLKKYFELVDTKSVWYKFVHWDELAKCRISNAEYDRKWFLFCKWFLYYKWKNDRRKDFEKRLEQIQLNHKKNVEEYIRKRNDAKERVKILVNFVLPLINNFSTKHTKYSVWEIYTIEQILEMEGIKYDE